MLGSYVLTLYRSLLRHRLFSALNILGLAVGMAVFLVLSISVRHELSYDRWIPRSERIFRVDGIMMIPGRPEERIGLIPGPVLPHLRAEFDQVEAGVRLLTQTIAVRRGERGGYERVIFADPTFFEIFDLPLAAGSKADALPDLASVVISEAMAEKYFGARQAVGERLTLRTDGTLRDYRVSAVLKDLPENTHLSADFIARLDESVLPRAAEYLDVWNATNYATYIRLPDAAAAGTLEAALPAFLQRRSPDAAAWMRLSLTALPEVHYNTSVLGAFKPGVDRRFVAMLQVIAVLTLALAVINYVNLATARAGLRAREVALRKVFGAERGALVVQFLVEAAAVSLFAGLIALALVELALPLVNTALGQTLELRYLGSGGVLPVFLGVTLLVGLAAGVYPALVLSRFEPAGVLAASRTPGGGRMAAAVRELLVVAQFAVSTALLIGTAVVFAQSDFVRRADLGFQRDKLILVREVGSPELALQRNTVQDAFRRIPGVVAVTLSGRYPGHGGTGRSQGFVRPGLQADDATLAWEVVGNAYFETYGLRLLAGRTFSLANRLDDRAGLDGAALSARGLNVVINETAARGLEYGRPADAVGAVIRPASGGPALRVVGVVRDARFGGPRETVPPILYVLDTSPAAEVGGYETIAVRYRGDPAEMLASLQAAWRGVVPGAPFKGETVEASLNTFYEPDERRSRLVTLGAVVAALIGCVGLYGLAAFASERRTKEIGVRKVLGASATDVFRLLTGQFLRPVAVASLIAWPAAFLVMTAWLDSFDQRIALTPVYFLAATALALAVALATVAGQAFKAARADPGPALRQE